MHVMFYIENELFEKKIKKNLDKIDGFERKDPSDNITKMHFL